MTNLKQKRLANLNKLLMEQSKYAGDLEAEMPVSSKEDKEDRSSLVDKVVTGATGLLTYKGGKAALLQALKKAGVISGEEVVKKGLLRRVLSSLGPRALMSLAAEIATFQALAAEYGFIATAAAAGAGLTAGATGAAIGGGLIIGTPIGIGLNKLFSSPDLDKEVKERIEKAKEDVNYAKAELDVYCRGTGALCRKDVECSGKPGGYEYSKADGYETWLGLGAGRELFGVPGFRTFKQTPNSFHANDGAVMVGLAFALILHDQKNDLIVLPNEENKLKKAEIKDGAVSKEYQDCIKGWLTQSRVMLAQIKKFGLEEAYNELRFFYGIDALPELPTDKEKASTEGPAKGNQCKGYPIVPGCVGDTVNNIIAILIRGTQTGAELLAKDRAKILKMADESTMTPDVIAFIKQVLQKENPEVLKSFEDNTIDSSKDPLSIYLNQLAKDKNITETLIAERIDLNKDPLDVIKEQRLRSLNKKLMGK